MTLSPSSARPGPAEAVVAEAPSPAPEAPLVESLLAAPVVHQTFGVVERKEGRALFVRAGAELVEAARSKSCLLDPAVGDAVLVARSDHHGSWVLAVLSSPEDAPGCTVEVEGDLTLRSKTGKVAIAGEAVQVAAGKKVAVAAPELVATSTKATLFADSLTYVGRTIDAQVERVRQVGKSMESVFETVTARMRHSLRTVTGVEKVTANELHVRAESTLNVHGKNTLMTAEKLVKLDGEQIHLG